VYEQYESALQEMELYERQAQLKADEEAASQKQFALHQVGLYRTSCLLLIVIDHKLYLGL